MSHLFIDIEKPDDSNPILTISASGDYYDVWTLFALSARELAEKMELPVEWLLDGAKNVLAEVKRKRRNAWAYLHGVFQPDFDARRGQSSQKVCHIWKHKQRSNGLGVALDGVRNVQQRETGDGNNAVCTSEARAGGTG